ncbi:MAG: rod shape-determining protein MreD [Lachnospiraceae bacterium]|nr:rod shape-determining protein MreD [Lachnospiraceae bacterium]
MTRLKRLLVIMISVIVMSGLQMMVLPRVEFLTALPNLLLIVVMASGFLFGKAYGLFVGALTGLLIDVVGTGTPGFHTLILMWIGYGDGFLSEKMESEIIPVLYLILLVNEVIYHVYIFVFGFFVGTRFRLLPYLKETVIPEVLLTLLVFLPIYGLLLFVSKRWDLKINKGEVKVV